MRLAESPEASCIGLNLAVPVTDIALFLYEESLVRWSILTAGEDGALECNSRRAGQLYRPILLWPRICLARVPCNSIQTNLGLWWPLTFHLFFPLPRLFASLLLFSVVGSSAVCILVALIGNHSDIAVVE